MLTDLFCVSGNFRAMKENYLTIYVQYFCDIQLSLFLDAVSNFQVHGKENISLKESGLASLFYWIPVWTDEQVCLLEDTIHNNQCSSSLVKKILTILSLK